VLPASAGFRVTKSKSSAARLIFNEPFLFIYFFLFLFTSSRYVTRM